MVLSCPCLWAFDTFFQILAGLFPICGLHFGITPLTKTPKSTSVLHRSRRCGSSTARLIPCSERPVGLSLGPHLLEAFVGPTPAPCRRWFCGFEILGDVCAVVFLWCALLLAADPNGDIVI